ncbi:MAG: hypothetical protein KA180_01770 [Gemmatimonadales bacterium]|jgi:hypothetical protein|nr:hypothetical protein [Gemmatimonadales bacterium]MBP9200643.1 hypothetical protein [Gemmatimonadales bacterium]
MPRRRVTVDGQRWEVSPTGRVSQYTRDEFGVRFSQPGAAGEVRVARFAPLGSRLPEEALLELSDAQLLELFHRSQPSWTAPETEYRR